MERTYTIKIECRNCNQFKKNVEIEKGTTVEKFLKYFECPVCGCYECREVKPDLIWTTTNSTDDKVISGGYTPSNTPSIYHNQYEQETYLCN